MFFTELKIIYVSHQIDKFWRFLYDILANISKASFITLFKQNIILKAPWYIIIFENLWILKKTYTFSWNSTNINWKFKYDWFAIGLYNLWRPQTWFWPHFDPSISFNWKCWPIGSRCKFFHLICNLVYPQYVLQATLKNMWLFRFLIGRL